MSDVRFIDTTVRDGNQSLWALNMRTDHMLAVAEHVSTRPVSSRPSSSSR